MKGRLVYIVGPSGSGKDSVISAARALLPAGADVAFARRTITRPESAGGEHHRAVTMEGFERLLADGAFAMHWRANGHAYGIGREMLDWLAEGRTVVVSGSRAHLPEALAAFPGMEVVLVTAAPDLLRRRLLERGREDSAQVAARLERADAFDRQVAAAQALRIVNEGALDDAGRVLAECLLRRPIPLSQAGRSPRT
jgi:ribose 1,5-bisphosphokinase